MRTINPEKHAARRAAILAAAAEVFAEHGYDGATTAAICKRAKIGSGTLFHYFPDKRSIFLAIVADDLADASTRLARIDHADPVDALGQVIDLLAEDLGNPIAPGLAFAMMQLAIRDEEFAATVTARDEQIRAVLAELIAQAQAVGVVAGIHAPGRAARWIVGITDAGYLMSDDPGFDPAADGIELRRIVAAYLGLSNDSLLRPASNRPRAGSGQ